MFIFSFDDYCEENYRIAELLQSKNIKATFYIELYPQKGRGTFDDAIKQIEWLSDIGMEIGGHSMTHPSDLKHLNEKEFDYEIVKSKYILEKITGKKITKFAYPRGRYNKGVKKVLYDAGYTEARTTKIGDANNVMDKMEMVTTVHIYNRNEYNGLTWQQWFEKHKHDAVVHTWAHGWEMTENNDWNDFEKIIKGL